MASYKYELTECERCGGSGHYSYCQMHGTTCFGCGGTGRSLTKAGNKARTAIRALQSSLRATKRADAVVAGDVVKSFDGKFRTVVSAERGSSYTSKVGNVETSGHMTMIQFKQVCWSTPESSVIELPLSPENVVKVTAFARTLQGVTVVD